MFGTFYHSIVRKTVVSFGTLFNNIYVERTNGTGTTQKIKIPLLRKAVKYLWFLNLSLSS